MDATQAGPEGWVRRYHTHAVWEITLKCNLACSHCGSRAGDARTDELSTEEALDLVRQMAEVGITEVTLIGGEAFLRRDWLDIARAVRDHGMQCSMTTGGFGISRRTAAKMSDAGISTVSVSVDGLEEVHDKLRGREGSFEFALRTMGYLVEAGISLSCNSQINRLSVPQFPRLYELLRDNGMRAWQIQMTVPMGNAADHSEILLQPVELLLVFPMLTRIVRRARSEGVAVMVGNNVGYYGPFESELRNMGDAEGPALWQGCKAGLKVLGIEADGAIKGCPSLPTTAYTGGNIRENSLHQIVSETPELTFNLTEGTPQGRDHLWGFCAGCDFGDLCRGGCNWTAHVFFDRRGNNPYCHHRALVHANRGLRERVHLARAADGIPFDNGVFELVEESFDAPWPQDDRLRLTADSIEWPEGWEKDPEQEPAATAIARYLNRIGEL